eukprot:5467726-Alexandrium_andersonii.AAC.1
MSYQLWQRALLMPPVSTAGAQDTPCKVSAARMLKPDIALSLAARVLQSTATFAAQRLMCAR